jgi:hypothetical protein
MSRTEGIDRKEMENLARKIKRALIHFMARL